MKTHLVMTVVVLVAIAAGTSFLPALTASASGEAAQRSSGAGAPAKPASSKGNPEEAVWQGKKFRRGDRVRVTSWAGTIKPDESAHPTELNVGAGRTGTVIRGEKRKATSYFTPDPNEPIQILRIRWDKQRWTDTTGTIVKLDVFETTVHADYLRVVGKPK